MVGLNSTPSSNGIGSPIRAGVRYILAGFCDYSEQSFLSLYDPVYDGFAAQAGFRNRDIIHELEVCFRLGSGSEDSNNESGCSSIFTEGCHPVQQLLNGDSHLQTVERGGGVGRAFVPIDGNTTDEQWVQYAQSCEQLAPGQDTVLVVKRLKQGTTLQGSLI